MSSTARKSLRPVLLLAGLALLCACSTTPVYEVPAPDTPTDLDQVRAYGDALLDAAHRESPRSGFAAAIVTRDTILWVGSIGEMTGTGAEALPVTPDLPMHIGSITKVFTALAVMQLVEQGKLELDANLRTYLPEFSIHSRFGSGGFTLRQMLTHYSGLPSDLLDDFGSASTDTRALFDATVARTAQTHLKSRPDLAHSYSNLAFSLLGTLIERVSGEAYDDYIREHVLAPLQMRQSAVLVPDADGSWPLVPAPGDPRHYGYEPIAGLPAGAIVSSLNDMARFAQVLLADGTGVVSPQSFSEMQRVQDAHATLGGGTQGLPFQLAFPPAAAQFSFGHSGALPGHYAWLRVFPGQDIAIVVLETTDYEEGKTDRLGGNLRDVALEYAQPGSSHRPERAQVPAAPRIPQSDGEAARYAGWYFALGLGLIEVANDDGALTLRLASTRLANARLLAIGNDNFVPGLRLLGLIPVSAGLIGLDDAQLHFVFDGDRRYITLAANGAPPQPFAASLEPGNLTDRWRRRLGTYLPADANNGIGLLAKVTLAVDAKLGIATVDARTTQGQQLGLALELLSDSQAAIAGVGRYTGEVLEFVSDDEFIFEGARFKRL